jgi:hypothetical protein
MKKVALLAILAVGAFVFAFSNYAPAIAAPAFEDPQLCVDGKLLRVDPTTAPIDVWVKVGHNLDVDFDVVNCGGNPDLPTVDPGQVSTDGKKNTVEVTVQTDPKARVIVLFDGKTKTPKANKDGWVNVKFKVK